MGRGDGGIRDGKKRWQHQRWKSKLGQQGVLVYILEGKRDKCKVEGESKGRKGVKAKEIWETSFKNRMRPSTLSSNSSVWQISEASAKAGLMHNYFTAKRLVGLKE